MNVQSTRLSRGRAWFCWHEWELGRASPSKGTASTRLSGRGGAAQGEGTWFRSQVSFRKQKAGGNTRRFGAPTGRKPFSDKVPERQPFETSLGSRLGSQPKGGFSGSFGYVPDDAAASQPRPNRAGRLPAP